MASQNNKKAPQRKHTEIYLLNDVRVSKEEFGKFVNSLHDRSVETCEKTRDGGTTYFDASDDRSNRYRISHQVSYSRDNAGEVKASTEKHEIYKINEHQVARPDKAKKNTL